VALLRVYDRSSRWGPLRGAPGPRTVCVEPVWLCAGSVCLVHTVADRPMYVQRRLVPGPTDPIRKEGVCMCKAHASDMMVEGPKAV
jgi:hypothetical protein